MPQARILDTGKLRIDIHTHDRITYKRCRRRWTWSSPTRGYLELVGASPAPLWFGTGFHFAMEDYNGDNVWGNPFKAYQAYRETFHPQDLPSEWADLEELAQGMLHYYELWEARRREFETLWIDGIPQVEVNFEIPLYDLWDNTSGEEYSGREVWYVGTFDRVVTDSFGRVWILDYKTAARIDTDKLQTDPQVGAYSWAGDLLFEGMGGVEGVLYQQHAKVSPGYPDKLANGIDFSQNKQKPMSYAFYHEALRREFGGVPDRYVQFLNYLASLESPEGDAFIRRDPVRRNKFSNQMEFLKICAEVAEMVSPDTPIYPNPTRDCKWDCPFRDPCLAMDDGSDYEYMLQMGYQSRFSLAPWRSRVQWPTEATPELMAKPERIEDAAYD